VFTSVAAAWFAYQAQSLISINQIGLAVWGWVLSGSLIAYSRFSLDAANQKDSSTLRKKQKLSKETELKPISVVYGAVFGLVGLLVSLPPLAADAKWRSAQESTDAKKLEQTMLPGLFNPLNSQKLVLNAQTFESSNLFDLSHKYALEAVRWNPDSYDSWRILYHLRNSTSTDRQIAVENMKRLDPLNPDVTSIK
jgi:hypothetical protein